MRQWLLLRTRNPTTFNEKVRYKMLRDRRSQLVVFADKAQMRAHVAAAVGEQHLPRLHGLWSEPDALLTAELPATFVLKPTHGSGACVVVSSAASAEAVLPAAEHGWVYSHVRPPVDRRQLAAIAQGWITKTYGRGPNHEWAYGRVRPQVLAEELLRSPSGGIPDDVKLFVFSGRCVYVQLDADRFAGRTQDFFTRDGVPLALRGGAPRGHLPPPAPATLAAAVELAETLAGGEDFVRVDLYCLHDRLVVGELTTSPAGGDSPFFPAGFDEQFGQHWTVPRRYRV